MSIYDKRIDCFKALRSADPVEYRETFAQCEHIIKPHGDVYPPFFPINNRSKCFARLIENQKSMQSQTGECEPNAEARLAGLQEWYRVAYMQCAAAIKPKVDMLPTEPHQSRQDEQ